MRAATTATIAMRRAAGSARPAATAPGGRQDGGRPQGDRQGGRSEHRRGGDEDRASSRPGTRTRIRIKARVARAARRMPRPQGNAGRAAGQAGPVASARPVTFPPPRRTRRWRRRRSPGPRQPGDGRQQSGPMGSDGSDRPAAESQESRLTPTKHPKRRKRRDRSGQPTSNGDNPAGTRSSASTRPPPAEPPSLRRAPMRGEPPRAPAWEPPPPPPSRWTEELHGLVIGAGSCRPPRTSGTGIPAPELRRGKSAAGRDGLPAGLQFAAGGSPAPRPLPRPCRARARSRSARRSRDRGRCAPSCARRVLHEQVNLAVVRLVGGLAQGLDVLVVHREDQVEDLEVGRLDAARPQVGDVDAAPRGRAWARSSGGDPA